MPPPIFSRRCSCAGWTRGAEAYLGMAVAGFPNLFLLYGPNSNVGSGSIVHMLECQQRYITQIIQQQVREGWRHISVREETQAAFVAEVRRRSAASTFEGDCQSWYKTAEGRNTNNWIGSMREYARRTARDSACRAFESSRCLLLTCARQGIEEQVPADYEERFLNLNGQITARKPLFSQTQK